jgi:hypothetical protein
VQDTSQTLEGIMKSFKTFITEAAEFRQDNPAARGEEGGKEWLDDNKKYAEEKAKKANGKGATGKGITGAQTGYFKGLVKLPTSAVHKIPGANGEEAYRGDNSSDKNKNLEKTIGDPSKFDMKKHPALIAVNHKGEAHVMEGNHRIAYAQRHGISHIHTEVRYWNGGEDVKGNMHPDKVKALHNKS